MDHKIDENTILLFDEIGATTIDPDSLLEQFDRAVSENDFLNVSKLIKDLGVDPSNNGNSSIEWASYLGNTEVVRVLLEDPRVCKNIYNRDIDPLHCAASQGHIETVILLLKHHRNYELINISPTMANGHIEIAHLIKEYVESRIDEINQKNK